MLREVTGDLRRDHHEQVFGGRLIAPMSEQLTQTRNLAQHRERMLDVLSAVDPAAVDQYRAAGMDIQVRVDRQGLKLRPLDRMRHIQG